VLGDVSDRAALEAAGIALGDHEDLSEVFKTGAKLRDDACSLESLVQFVSNRYHSRSEQVRLEINSQHQDSGIAKQAIDNDPTYQSLNGISLALNS
jgi:septation ring formation regulator EzrA